MFSSVVLKYLQLANMQICRIITWFQVQAMIYLVEEPTLIHWSDKMCENEKLYKI